MARKENDRPDSVFVGACGLPANPIERETATTRHRENGLIFGSIVHEQRIDEVLGSQPGLPVKRAEHLVATVATGTRAEFASAERTG